MDRTGNPPSPLFDYAPVQSTSWPRPATAWAELEERDEWVIKWKGDGGRASVGAAQDVVLSDFMDLVDASPDEVARFVMKWGTLDLCDHGLPRTHLPRRMWSDLDLLGQKPCDLVWRGRYPQHEKVERWLYFAGQAAALHEAAGLILSKRRVPDELWEQMRELYPSGWVLRDQNEALESWRTSDQQWVAASALSSQPIDWGFGRAEPIEISEYRLITHAVQRWLDLGDVRIHVRWDNAQGTITYGGTGLMGAIALQLALTCTRIQSFYTCTGCGSPYTPRRRPREGQNHYCEDCRERNVDGAERTRRYQARKTAARHNTEQGKGDGSA